ncbi:hypothetical protein J6590_096185, partial [Homalodisca vitripennis]
SGSCKRKGLAKVLSVYRLSSDPTEKILKWIIAQNSSHEIAEWKLTKRSNDRTTVHLLMSGLNPTRQKDYKILYTFGKVNMHYKSMSKKSTKQTVKRVTETSHETPQSLQTNKGEQKATKVHMEQAGTVKPSTIKKQPDRKP